MPREASREATLNENLGRTEDAVSGKALLGCIDCRPLVACIEPSSVEEAREDTRLRSMVLGVTYIEVFRTCPIYSIEWATTGRSSIKSHR